MQLGQRYTGTAMAVAVQEVRQKLAEAKVSMVEAKREVQGPSKGLAGGCCSAYSSC